ncbi:MAG: hypothetical protein ABSB09_10030 [Acidimicrobiales bacterium]|jgi:hypothetical protein
MRLRRLDVAQRAVVVIGMGIALYLFGQWLIGFWEGGSAGSFGWVAYAPLSGATNPPVILLHPWVRLLIWLALTTVWVLASVAVMSGGRVLDSFGSIAVDAEGDIYASSVAVGWSVFEISPNGVATNLGYARRSGGTTAVVRRGPDDVIEVDDGSDILRVADDRLVTDFAVDDVPGTGRFALTNYFTLAPDGTFYADNTLQTPQQIISVAGGHGVSLWQGAARR